MSINAVSAVSQLNQGTGQSPVRTHSPAVPPFGQQLDDAQVSQTLAAHGYHHPRDAGGAQSPTATASPAGGGSTLGAAASTLLNVLSKVARL